MPPFTSTSLTTLLRRATTVVRQVVPSVKAASRARFVVQAALQDTYISLQPVRVQALQPAYIPAGSSRFSSPLQRASRVYASGRFVHTGTMPRGPNIISQVGLSSARSFSTGPAAFNAKIPIGFRALSSLLDKDDTLLPQPARYASYRQSWARSLHQRNKKHRRRVHLSNSSLSSSYYSSITKVDAWRRADIQSYHKYFVLPRRTSSSSSRSLPLRPEELITPGKVSILSIPLSPNIHALLEPTTSIKYDEAMIGINILSGLTAGLLPIHQAFDTYRAHRVCPLLAKLDGLGLLDPHEYGERTELEAEYDTGGDQVALRILFNGRSVKNVKALLTGTLKKEEEDGWWSLWQEDIPTVDSGPELSMVESREMMGDWSTPSTSDLTSSIAAGAVSASAIPTMPSEWSTISTDSSGMADTNSNLVIPTIDLDIAASTSDLDSETPPEIYSWPSSPSLLPSPPPTTANPDATIRTISASLLSELSNRSDIWSVAPSESDSDVESSIEDELLGMGSGVWSVSSGMQTPDEIPVGDGSELGRWSGSGEGFGFAQSW